MWKEVGEEPEGRGEGQGAEEVGGDGVGEGRHGQGGFLILWGGVIVIVIVAACTLDHCQKWREVEVEMAGSSNGGK